MYSYETKGVCSKQIKFDIVDDRITNVSFVGGCNGNLQGISRLVEGMKVEDAVKKLKGISCNGKKTSCPDQLAMAINSIMMHK